jgi:hypothetical protein
MLVRGGFAGQQPVPVVSIPDKGSAEPVVVAARAAVRASPLRPATTRIAIEPGMRSMPGPTR